MALDRPNKWTLDMGVELVRDVEPHLADAGWHVALTGGVLYRGSSNHDLDFVVFPHQRRTDGRPTRAALKKMRAALRRGGMLPSHSAAWVRRDWRRRGIRDRKHVEVWFGKGRRVDVIVLS